MKYSLTDQPGSVLTLQLEEGEEILTNPGSFLFASGKYKYNNKLELKGKSNWKAAFFGGKSLYYGKYKALEPLELILAPKGAGEPLVIEIDGSEPLFIKPAQHFARTAGLEMKTVDQKAAINWTVGALATIEGIGMLALLTYGRLLEKEIDTDTPVFLDEDSLVAYRGDFKVETVSQSIKETLTSGEGFSYSIVGKGKLWLQTRKKPKGELEELFG